MVDRLLLSRPESKSEWERWQVVRSSSASYGLQSLGRTGMGSPASCVTIVNPQPAPMGSQLGSQGGQICERNGRDNRDLAAEARTPADRRGANRSAGDLVVNSVWGVWRSVSRV